ncbi:MULTISPECIES: DUF438 domain-containing protein [unclassified Dysgonomonas]|jgi:DUF438 domain-containing protein|uniref:DUF438 domain-containing protein n=1 Tax=unclassified Dysgonomonas TaxID=2630389 RepID=UPI0025B9D430|nr:MULTISPECIES: DUF438 domain-containing protein [unclassified Dysgonomonas]MDR2003119.1 DUF438 domain-containing protein [Prevotella sp.]HMM04070.1 DUF438 domain-containing protein [Dysgonomonas sp.]
MSEVINNSQKRKELLKHLILQLHNNEAPEIVRKRLIELLRSVPYNEVVEVEQELISEGLPEEEVLRFCDIHTAVLDGSIDTSAAKVVQPGHPVDTFKRENRALEEYIQKTKALFDKGNKLKDEEVKEYLLQLKGVFNNLSDVDKHYKRKEYLLFPFLEKAGITGPPKVMWGKHDETRELLKAAHEALLAKDVSAGEVTTLILLILLPAIDALEGMIMKEEEILLPMCLDTLTDKDWYQIYKETPQFGFSLYDPQTEWAPESVEVGELTYKEGDAIHLSSGNFTTKELETIFKTLPVDVTFVDKDDKVKFFSHGTKKVFERNRSIIGRDVRLCHPPGSVHIVEQIINDFKSGKENVAAFWISSFMGRFVYIEYTALRGNDGEYLGVMEVTQDITDLRKLEGDQRLLSYGTK